MILNKKNEEAQLNFDLLREKVVQINFLTTRYYSFSVLMKNLIIKFRQKPLYFYLSSVTVENFKYEPTEKTDKNIWRYLAAHLITIEKLEDPQTISKYEVAANKELLIRKKSLKLFINPFQYNPTN